MRIRSLIAAAALALVPAPRAAAAQEGADFYKGKTVRFIVSVGVGGGFDTYARMIAPHLAKALEATVVVENQPGAGGILALNQMMISAPDGLRFVIINGTPALLAQILEQDNLKYDLTRIPHLGVIAAEPWAVLVRPDSPIRTPQDLAGHKGRITWAGSGPTGGPGDGASITCHALGLACRVVMGYRSSSEMALALQRSEIDALYVTDASAGTYDKGQQARAIAIAARERSAVLPGLPTLYDTLALTPEQTWWLDLRAELNQYGRVLLTMPGIPADRLAALRAAIAKVLTDPAVIAEGAKTQRFIEFRDGETMERLARKLATQLSPERKREVREVVLKKYIE